MGNHWNWIFDLFQWIFCKISHCVWKIFIRLCSFHFFRHHLTTFTFAQLWDSNDHTSWDCVVKAINGKIGSNLHHGPRYCKHFETCCCHQYHRDIRSWDIMRFNIFWNGYLVFWAELGLGKEKKRIARAAIIFTFSDVLLWPCWAKWFLPVCSMDYGYDKDSASGFISVSRC